MQLKMPSKMKFDRRELQDLVQRFRKECLEPFPILLLKHPTKVHCLHRIKCNMPDNMIIQCDNCEHWLHLGCAGLKSPPENESSVATNALDIHM